MRTMKAIAALAPVVLGAILAVPGGVLAAGRDHSTDQAASRAGAAAFGNFILQTGTALHETDDTFATTTTADWARTSWR
ncbi:hypothetical protein AF335_21225 [Streptomyces eurocidicus]|uniref:Uncharacterized protein n=1 Tax=Streptomyces eurocidicus TaxID=66423 RepID=A0A2N8NTX8_STREU|nr:hypothetical protein [Streptomyces eurocidicus]MBB5119291.1 hypothetical protein [Streptomyces eurocidicus]MBF6053125.1 hypothetical protein [Streptomyces eurocidicus]PNE32229.1 hypothetical protein AF335_21225 [Streptomyces eurocidicus]